MDNEKEIAIVEHTELAVVKRKNFIGRMGDKMRSIQDEAKDFMVEQLFESILPAVKKLLPSAERNLKDFLGEEEKMVVITKSKTGDINIMVMNQQKMILKPKDGVQPQEAVVAHLSFDELLSNMLSGTMEKTEEEESPK